MKKDYATRVEAVFLCLKRFGFLLVALSAIEVKGANSVFQQDHKFVIDAYTNEASWQAVKKRVRVANPEMLTQHPAFEFVKANPLLPNVLLIGDSVSIGYTQVVRKALKETANVYRVPTNGGWTTRGMQELHQWLSDVEWHVIHFNWGLYDLKRSNPSVTDGMDDRQAAEQIKANFLVAPETYRQNLHLLVTQLKSANARLIWASTTPVPQGSFNRISGDELAYNAIALGVMESNQIEVNDLHSAVLPNLKVFQRHKDVHFTAKGNQFLGSQVADKIRAALQH